MASARLAGLCRVVLPARIRRLKTLVVVASTNTKEDSSPLATLYADEDSSLGKIIREEVIRMRHELSHSGDACNSSGRSMGGHPLPCSEEVQSGGCRIDIREFNRGRNIFEKKLILDAAEAKRRDEVNSAEALARFRANHRFDMLEKQIRDGFKALCQEVTPLKTDVSQLKELTVKGLNEQSDALKAYRDKVEKQEKLQKDAAAQQDTVWVYVALDSSINKLPWGLPAVVKDMRSVWANLCAMYPMYPFVASTFLYLRNNLTPMEYFQILVLYHDGLIEPYLDKIGKVRG